MITEGIAESSALPGLKQEGVNNGRPRRRNRSARSALASRSILLPARLSRINFPEQSCPGGVQFHSAVFAADDSSDHGGRNWTLPEENEQRSENENIGSFHAGRPLLSDSKKKK